jgi:hypothetical protein
MTLTTLRTFIETALTDAAPPVRRGAADEDLTLAVGPDAAEVELADAWGERFLFLGRPAASITGITETIGTTVTTLAASDYKLWPDKTQIERLSTGTNPAAGWHGKVEVSYTPADLNRRDRALTQLVQLDLDYRFGATSEAIGDHNRSQRAYDEERVKIISGARTRSFA